MWKCSNCYLQRHLKVMIGKTSSLSGDRIQKFFSEKSQQFSLAKCWPRLTVRQKQQNQSLLTILVPIIKSLKPLGLRIFFTIVYLFTIKIYFSHDVTDVEQCIVHKSFLLSHRLWFLLLFVAKQDEIIGYNNIAIKVIKILHCCHQICFIFDILLTVLHTTRIRWVWSLMNKICLYSMSDRSRSRHYRTPYVSVKPWITR